MTFSLQLLMASGIFCMLILLVLGIQKKGYLNYKIVRFFMLVAASLFLCATLWYAYTEFTSYNARVQRYNQEDKLTVQKETTATYSTQEVDTYAYFQTYRNTLSGYAYFLIDMSRNSDQEQSSYIYTLYHKIVEQFSSEAYTQNYWNKVFAVVFQQDDSTKTYKKSNYELMYVIPPDGVYRDLNEDYGDLNDPKNLNYFERICKLMYIEGELKNHEYRTPEHIASLWQNNKAFFYTFFSKTNYDQLCKQVVDDLITVYDRIVAQPNYKTFYEQYDVTDDVFLDFPSKKFTSSYKFSWPFSFWDRRFSEQNSEQVYRILKEMQDHYKN